MEILFLEVYVNNKDDGNIFQVHHATDVVYSYKYKCQVL